MNDLSLDRVDRGDGAGDILRILLDGRDFVELAQEAEREAARADGQPELAGSYAGPALWRIPDLLAHLLGQPEPLYLSDGRVEVLVCAGCGEAGCWPLEVRIQTNERTIRWGDYRQPHRSHWRHSLLPEFVFDRAKYEAAIRRLVEQGWSGPHAA